MVGILSYGTYIPHSRIKTADIAPVWGKTADDIIGALGVSEKSVADPDEDAATLALLAASRALSAGKIDPTTIEALFVGSESHPYAVNPTATIVGELLGIGNNYLAVDLAFACKAATAGMQAVVGLIEAGKLQNGMIIGSDTAQARPHDILEYTAASAAAAFILSSSKKCIAHIIDFSSYSSDTPDFWRRDGMRYPSHGGRFTGQPAYFAHVEGASRRLLKKTASDAADFDFCVFHMPNGKFPRIVAKSLGFSTQQLAPSLVVDRIGNPYSASALLGLAAVLEQARPHQKIFFCSYGSGAGADSFILETTEHIKRFKPVVSVQDQIKTKHYISYVQYLKMSKTI